MQNMNPPGISPSRVIAKCTASSMTYGEDTDAFYGLFYVNDTLYKDCEQLNGTSDSRLDDLNSRYFPCFCVKSDGSSNIRWPLKSDINAMLPYCNSIIASLEPLVYGGYSVFESAIYDDYDGIRIANGSNLSDTTCHYNDYYCSNTGNSKKNRTLVGHKEDGTFFLVCADRTTMTLPVAAKMMVDLGCDYAVNMDGASATQMRVASGYTNGYTAGKMTVGGTNYYGSCVCVYIV